MWRANQRCSVRGARPARIPRSATLLAASVAWPTDSRDSPASAAVRPSTNATGPPAGQQLAQRVRVVQRDPIVSEVRTRRAAQRFPCPGPQLHREECRVAAEPEANRPFTQAGGKARRLVAPPCRATGEAQDHFDAAIGRCRMLDPCAGRTVVPHRPHGGDQSFEARGQDKLAIVHAAIIPVASVQVQRRGLRYASPTLGGNDHAADDRTCSVAVAFAGMG